MSAKAAVDTIINKNNPIIDLLLKKMHLEGVVDIILYSTTLAAVYCGTEGVQASQLQAVFLAAYIWSFRPAFRAQYIGRLRAAKKRYELASLSLSKAE